MTEQERINHEMQMKLAMQDAKFKIFIEEMRSKDAQRHAEIQALNASTDAKFAEIRQDLQAIRAEGRNQTIVTFIGIAAMVIAVLLK